MKKQFTLSVKAPCSEKWANFTPTANGGFCSSCRKNVVDFTAKSEREIVDFFKNRRSDTCGRFHSSQLRSYHLTAVPAAHPRINWIHLGLLGLALTVVSGLETKAQVDQKERQKMEVTHHQNDPVRVQQSYATISGRVVDEDGEPMPGVNVYLKDEAVGINTDVDGQFQFPKKVAPGQVLVFSFIGYEAIEYVVPNHTPPPLEISMTIADMELMGEIVVGGAYVHKANPIGGLWHKFKEIFE